MDTKKDIETRKDIELFVNAFYDKVKQDEVIGIIFTEIHPMNWEQHIPIIVDFWETILLDNPVYNKNAMEVHYAINKTFPLKKIHFDAWLKLFNLSLNELFSGKITELAKTRAASIAAVMEFKMSNA